MLKYRLFFEKHCGQERDEGVVSEYITEKHGPPEKMVIIIVRKTIQHDEEQDIARQCEQDMQKFPVRFSGSKKEKREKHEEHIEVLK